MGFYYLSIFSLFLIAAIYAVAIGAFWLVWARLLGRKFTGPAVWVVVAAIVIAPWVEELWIAYHFGQACKEAGTFIYKKVQVDGFYDDTTGWGPRQLAESKYRFVESKDVLYKALSRVERADDVSRDRALAWYADKNRGKQRPKDLYVVHPVSDKEQIVVSSNGVDAWSVTKIVRPTARYHYIWPNPYGARVAHKVGKSERIVIDTETKEEPIARYTGFGRRPPWFWIGLDRPAFACDAPGRWPLTRGSPLIYREVLIPAAQR